MLLFYVRHGDPTYQPDALTPLGRRQAESVAKRLALYGIDRVFSSTSTRAIQTAQPTCEILKKEMTQLEFAHENHAFEDFSVEREDGGRQWVYANPRMRSILSSAQVRAMGQDWTQHPAFSVYPFARGVRRVQEAVDGFFADLGYEHIAGTGCYRVLRENNERVAFFAHQGFSVAFLSSLLDIPYPVIAMHFDMLHTGVTAINFREDPDGISRPCLLTLSNDSHLYRDGLPTGYGQDLRF